MSHNIQLYKGEFIKYMGLLVKLSQTTWKISFTSAWYSGCLEFFTKLKFDQLVTKVIPTSTWDICNGWLNVGHLKKSVIVGDECGWSDDPKSWAPIPTSEEPEVRDPMAHSCVLLASIAGIFRMRWHTEVPLRFSFLNKKIYDFQKPWMMNIVWTFFLTWITTRGN